MEGLDRISALDDLILSHILSFLPTKEAVGASVLSSRWRNLSTFVPALDFELDEFLLFRERVKGSTINGFMCFVEKLLLFRNTRVDKFRLKCWENIDSIRVCDWISAACRRGVNHLDLNIPHFNFKALALVLFDCSTLVTLKLQFLFPLHVPKGFRFPILKTLHLKSVQFSNDDSINSLLSGCSSLKDLVIVNCYMSKVRNFNITHHLLKRLTIRYLQYLSDMKSLMIDTPNLAYFEYIGHLPARHSLDNMPSIVRADILISDDQNMQADETQALFRRIRNVRSLTLSSRSLKRILRCEPIPVFANLVELKVKKFYQEVYCFLPSCWLRNFRLQKLQRMYYDGKVYPKEWWSFTEVHNKCKHL